MDQGDHSLRVLVCGGRKYDNYELVEQTLDPLVAQIDLIIEGGAAGADELANRWAIRNDIPRLTVPAEWTKYGRAAGAIRNVAMLKLGPDLVIAFPGGKGTAHMVKIAKEEEIEVKEIQDETYEQESN